MHHPDCNWTGCPARVMLARPVQFPEDGRASEVRHDRYREGLMRRISALMLLGAAIGIMTPLGAAGRVEPMQAQNQAPAPEGFRIIGNIYWVGGEYGSY